jgi:UPF0716 protein FxsA
MLILLLALIVTPLAEIAAFIQIGGLIGLWPTLATVVATAVIGSILLRQQGLRTLREIQRQLNEGKLPVDEMLAGLCLFAAGLLLLTPGFITDVVGFALLIPPVRLWVARRVRHRLGERVVVSGGPRGHPGGPFPGGPFPGGHPGAGPGPGGRPGGPGPGKGRSGDIIDTSYETVDEEDSPANPPIDESRWGKH